MKQLNWKDAIYYGEVFGFLFAWAICLALAISGSRDSSAKPDAKNIASIDGGGFAFD